MNPGSIGLWGLLAGAALAGLYGLHRLALRLEANGLLYYRDKQRTGSAGGCFVALQRAVEPGAEHALVVHEASTPRAVRPPGSAEPPGSRPNPALHRDPD